MDKFVLDPSLFIVLAIIIGFAVSPILTYVENYDRVKESVINSSRTFGATMLLAGGFALLNLYYISIGKVDKLPALAPLGMMIAAFIASAGLMKSIAATKENESKKHAKEDSKFYLEKCTEGLKHIYELLKDGSNTNMTWGEASKTLLVMLEMSANITDPSHKSVFKIEKNKYRHMLLHAFNDLNIKKAFFYGYKNWKELEYSISHNAYTSTKLTHIFPSNIIPIIEFLFSLNTSKKMFEDYDNWDDIKLSWITQATSSNDSSNDNQYTAIENLSWVIELYDYFELRIQNKDIKQIAIDLSK